MKKLMIASAVAAVAVAGVASASISPFVRADLGYTTNNILPYAELKQVPGVTVHHAKPVVGGIAVGADLMNLGMVKLGAEVDGTYTVLKTKVTDVAADQAKVTQYAIDPMAYVSFQALPKLSIVAKAGYGYQHIAFSGSAPSLQVLSVEGTDSHWAPVVAAELGYAINDRISVRVGDRYTFGHNYSTRADAAKVTDSHFKPRTNVAYVGIQYNF
jgi:hypothetical protein